MFKNRALQVKLIKTDKKNVPTQPQTEEQFEGKVAVIAIHLRSAVKDLGLAVVAYVAIDTVRQVLVAKATNP